GAGKALRVVPGGLDPDLPAVHVHDPLGDGEAKPRPLRLESDLAAGVLLDVAHFVELVEDPHLVLPVDADAGVGDGDLEKEMVLAARTGRIAGGNAAHQVLSGAGD